MERRLIYLCDIDGTIADLAHRLPLIQRKEPDWNGFFLACESDLPILPVIQTIQLLANLGGAHIIGISGRSMISQQQTDRWLTKHHVPFCATYMRAEGDHRPDNIVKSELLDRFLEEWKLTEQDITAVFEDRDQVVKMYRDRGLRVFQVADGYF